MPDSLNIAREFIRNGYPFPDTEAHSEFVFTTTSIPLTTSDYLVLLIVPAIAICVLILQHRYYKSGTT